VRCRSIIVAMFLLALPSLPLWAQGMRGPMMNGESMGMPAGQKLPGLEFVGIEQHLNAEIPADLAFRDGTLVAPTDAVILSRSIEVGTLANAGTVAFVLADLTRVKAVFGVPDSLVPRVKTGASLSVTTDAFANVEFPGRITAVSPSADAQSRVFSVEVTIPNPHRQLKAGMVATVEVPAPAGPEIPAGQPTVSLGAIVKSARTGGGYAVFVAEGPDERTVARARDVGLGGISGNRVAVTTGIKAGEKVIVTGASLLVDGDPVRVIPGSEGE